MINEGRSIEILRDAKHGVCTRQQAFVRKFMRKYHQKMILELLKSLEEATDNLKKLFSKKEFQALTNLLADCQESAVQIGQFIEQLEGEQEQKTQRTSRTTIAYLEEYCELLYLANEELNKPESGAGPIKKLQKQIIKIEESVKSDLKPDKIEIVFFPYKASMWDSLESIWLAAKDDPACDAYVVPIPYYDKNPDGAFGQMHYEGDKYPDYVPVVDWQKYNVEERRPDAVFIHNPYDGGNYVTSVHQDYYAERLKGFTDCLVYVPYFVVGGYTVDENFAAAAGCVHAHKVITQSEKVRESYIKTYKKLIGNAQGKPEEKFIALGSPKFDAVINKKREDFKMPDEWVKMIAGKKIVLYNTSLNAILKGDGKYLEKLRWVIETFKGRDDIVLWWRPHPLSESTYKSMRSHLLEEYINIVGEYKRQGWGIYDDTSDLHRAIAWSDGYYGTTGSLLPLYACYGKPLMVQNISIIRDNNCSDLGNIYDDGDNYWIVAMWDISHVILFKIDKRHNQTEYIGGFPKEIVNTQWLSEKVKVSGGNIQNLCKVEDKIVPNWFLVKNPDMVNNISDCLYREFVFCKLSDFLNHIVSDETIENKTALRSKRMDVARQIIENADGTCGIKTYEYVKSEVSK